MAGGVTIFCSGAGVMTSCSDIWPGMAVSVAMAGGGNMGGKSIDWGEMGDLASSMGVLSESSSETLALDLGE